MSISLIKILLVTEIGGNYNLVFLIFKLDILIIGIISYITYLAQNIMNKFQTTHPVSIVDRFCYNY